MTGSERPEDTERPETTNRPKKNDPRAKVKADKEVRESADDAYEERHALKDRPAPGDESSPWKRVEVSSSECGRHGHGREGVEDSIRKEGQRRKEERKEKQRKKWGIALAGCCVALVAVVAIGISVVNMGGQSTDYGPKPEQSELISSVDTTKIPESNEGALTYNPINFLELVNQNPDIYAWLYVPGTQVNMPVLQSDLADNYYLYRNVNKEDDPTGAAYTQSLNSKDFTDPVTVIYGHTFQPDDERAEAAFGTLHNFEDKAFFDEHPFFYVYTPKKMYTYKIVSAGEVTDEHILNEHDFSDRFVLQEYLDEMQHPTGDHSFESGMEQLQAGQAYVVQLSTCTIPSVPEKRYLVSGVMVGEKNLQPSW